MKTLKYKAYSLKTGEHVGTQVRQEDHDGKKVRNPYWEASLGGTPMSELELYNARNINGAEEVVLVEGPNKAKALVDLGICAASSWVKRPIKESLECLLPVRKVIVWADNDKTGDEKAEALIEELNMLGHSDVRRVLWQQAPPKGDVRDAIAAGVDIRKLIAQAEKIDPPQPARTNKSRKHRQCVELVDLALERAEYWHDMDQEVYATVEEKGHKENWKVNSKPFWQYLGRIFYEETGKIVHSDARRDASDLLKGEGQFKGQEHKVFRRVGSFNDGVVLDLANDNWEVVQITADGWSVVSDSPVKFIRSVNSRRLPRPIRGYCADESLFSIMNLQEDDVPLVRSVVSNTIFPTGAKPILNYSGQAGSAKSSATKITKDIVDPSKAPIRAMPRNEHDLMIACKNNWVIAYDNVSTIPYWLSDALCRISTGAGFSVRQLYSDDEEVVFEVQRPIILNGITALAERGDLLDRTIPIDLPVIDPDHMKTEAEIEEEFTENHPKILGGILDYVAASLKESSIKLPSLHRMSDFHRRSVAAEHGMNWEESEQFLRFGKFEDSYKESNSRASESALTSSIIGMPIVKLMEQTNNWSGTSTDLLEALNNFADEPTKQSKKWNNLVPDTVGKQIRRIAPNLRNHGIVSEFNKREITLRLGHQ